MQSNGFEKIGIAIAVVAVLYGLLSPHVSDQAAAFDSTGIQACTYSSPLPQDDAGSVHNEERAKQQARLEICKVYYIDDQPVMARTREELLESLSGTIPKATKIVPHYTYGYGEDSTISDYYLVSTDSFLINDYLFEAQAERSDATNEVVINIKLSNEGGVLMREYTGSHIRKLLAVVLDGKAIQVATVLEELGSEFILSGRFSEAEAQELCAELRKSAAASHLDSLF